MTRLSTRFTALFPFIVLSHVVLFFSLTASGQCTLCYDGSDPPHPDLVLPDFDDLSCGTLATRAAVISKSSGDDDNDDELCKEYALLGLMCGCPAPEQACTLCEDASPVPNVNKEDLMMIGQYVCKELEWEGNLQSSVDWNLCPAWRASFGVYCGCDNPVSSEGYCRVCGGDQLLPDPSRFVSVDELGFEVTCADIELNEEDESCDIIQSTYSMACCASTTSTTENTTLTGSNATINNEISNETEQTSSPGFNATIDNETATEIVPESDETLHQGNDTTLTTENSTTSTASNKTTGDDATETETQGGSTEIVEIIVNETLSPSNDLDDSIETKPVNPDEQEVLNSTILSVTSSATVYSGVCSTLFYCFAGVYVIILVVSCD